MMNFAFRSLLLATLICSHAHAANMKQVYLDDKQNVHVVTSTGKDLRITKTGNRTKAQLSSDGETAAWLVNHTWKTDGQSETAANELVIYRHGKTRSIKCEPFIREYWFWMNGSRVAIDCGGSHFAGREILYDVKTLKKLDSFDQGTVPTNKRPTWSSSSDNFDQK